MRLLSDDDIDAWADFLGDPEATRLLHTPEPVRDRERTSATLRRWIEMIEGPIGMYSLTVRDTGRLRPFGAPVRNCDTVREAGVEPS